MYVRYLMYMYINIMYVVKEGERRTRQGHPGILNFEPRCICKVCTENKRPPFKLLSKLMTCILVATKEIVVPSKQPTFESQLYLVTSLACPEALSCTNWKWISQHLSRMLSPMARAQDASNPKSFTNTSPWQNAIMEPRRFLSASADSQATTGHVVQRRNSMA